MSASFITPGHVRAYELVRSQRYDNITLTSCTINGEPGVAIVMLDEPTDGLMAVMPLFVGITPGMQLAFPGEQGAGGSGGGGGPRRGFQEAKAATEPRATPS